MLGVFDKPSSLLQQPTVVYNTVHLNLDTHIDTDTVRVTDTVKVKDTDTVNVKVTDTVNVKDTDTTKETEAVSKIELSDVRTGESNPRMENTEVNSNLFSIF